MKKILIFLLLVPVKLSFSQTTIGFENTNSTWNVASSGPGGSIQFPDFVATTTSIYGFKGDTLIDSKLWNKMYVTSDSDFQTSSNLKKVGYLREENKLVFFIDNTSKLDTLYNFNLHVGDSAYYNVGSGYNFVSITSIDSVNIDENYKKRFFFSEPKGVNDFSVLKEIWIEDIGSVHGPLFPANPRRFLTEIPDSLLLICCKNSNSITWSNPNYNECYLNIVLSVKELTELSVRIFPNPVTNELRIDIPETNSEHYTISIFDLMGKLVTKDVCEQNEQIEINTSEIQNGFYMLQVASGDKIIRIKFIKQ